MITSNRYTLTVTTTLSHSETTTLFSTLQHCYDLFFGLKFFRHCKCCTQTVLIMIELSQMLYHMLVHPVWGTEDL